MPWDKEQKREYEREYYQKHFSSSGDRHERYREERNAYKRMYEKSEKYKEGKRKRDREDYQRNSEKIREKVKAAQQETVMWFRQYKTTVKCIKCGENNAACLHFHHRDKLEKEKNVAFYAFHAHSLEKLIQEINKCDVLCANCHRIEHWQEKEDKHSNLEQQQHAIRSLLQNGKNLSEVERRKLKKRLAALEFESFKCTLSCMSCGINHPACLEFHHRDSKEKTNEVSNIVNTHFRSDGWKREIEKCDVLCANCHAKLHWKGKTKHDEEEV